MMYLVDTVSVEPVKLGAYLETLQLQALPLYTSAGAALEYCRTTATDLGELVEVEVAWSFADNAPWNDIRRTLVLDPRYYQCAQALAALRTGGSRRFQRAAVGFDSTRP